MAQVGLNTDLSLKGTCNFFITKGIINFKTALCAVLLVRTDIQDRNYDDSAYDDDSDDGGEGGGGDDDDDDDDDVDDDGYFMQTTLASVSRWVTDARRKTWILHSTSLTERLWDLLASPPIDTNEILQLE
jgi:hypothetical protein